MESKEEKILAFRTAFNNLPSDVREREVMRLQRIINGGCFIVLEDHDIGKVIKFLNVPSLIEYLYREKNIRVSRSYIYRVLKGQYSNAHGYNIYYETIE